MVGLPEIILLGRSVTTLTAGLPLDSNALWIVERGVPHKGGPIRWNHHVRLMHFNTGLYLADNIATADTSDVTLTKGRDLEENLFCLRTVSPTDETAFGDSSSAAPDDHRVDVEKSLDVQIQEKMKKFVKSEAGLYLRTRDGDAKTARWLKNTEDLNAADGTMRSTDDTPKYGVECTPGHDQGTVGTDGLV